MTGTERKVFQKYYPPDFDPSKIPRAKGAKNRQFVQRVMTPFNMQCNTCHEYIYKGKKFNMKRETVEGETYLNLKLFRFYFKCPNCLAEITFKTDLENCDYQNEHGATRLFEAFKKYQDAEKQRETQEEEDKKDPMKMLEKRTMMSRQEMEALGDLEDMQEMSRQKQGVDTIEFLQTTDPHRAAAEILKWQEEQDEKSIASILGITKTEDGKIQKRLADDDDEDEDVKPGTSTALGRTVKTEDSADTKPIDLKPSFAANPPTKRGFDQKSILKGLVVKKAKPETSIKQEVEDPEEASGSGSSTASAVPEVVKKQDEPQASVGLLGLSSYGSDSDSD